MLRPFVPKDLMAQIKPWNWPQNKLVIPPGVGSMPQVTAENMHVEREGFVYSTYFLNVGFGQTVSTVIPTTPDGDFWCSSILIQNFVSFGGPQARPDLRVKVQDLRTGRQMFKPYIPASALQTRPDGELGLSASTFSPYGGYSTFVQPFPFTRNGGIKLEIENAALANIGPNTPNIFVGFIGWKEYQYASK